MTADQQLAARAIRNIDRPAVMTRIAAFDLDARREHLERLRADLDALRVVNWNAKRLTGESFGAEFNSDLDSVAEGIHIALTTISKWSAQ